MKETVLKLVYNTLREGYERILPEAQKALRTYVRSQRTKHGYMNAGGVEDPYYRQFGKALECVFSIWKLWFFNTDFVVTESLDSDTVYGQFFRYLQVESPFGKREKVDLAKPKRMTTNAACCILVMQHQTNTPLNKEVLTWLKERQDETGGFYASEQAPIPDLLSTAVALFTLRLVGVEAKDASDFVQAHWLEGGGFTPTLLDDYSDVEYCFYGLLALGSTTER